MMPLSQMSTSRSSRLNEKIWLVSKMNTRSNPKRFETPSEACNNLELVLGLMGNEKGPQRIVLPEWKIEAKIRSRPSRSSRLSSLYSVQHFSR